MSRGRFCRHYFRAADCRPYDVKGTVLSTLFPCGRLPLLQFYNSFYGNIFRDDEGIVPYESGKGKPFPYKASHIGEGYVNQLHGAIDNLSAAPFNLFN